MLRGAARQLAREGFDIGTSWCQGTAGLQHAATTLRSVFAGRAEAPGYRLPATRRNTAATASLRGVPSGGLAARPFLPRITKFRST